jgi:hypothetical protein
MDPILRRSSFYYVTSLVMYMSLMGRYMLTRDWPVFEIMPLFVPVWILGGLLASESDECYAFLRTLPVPDRRVARTKFTLILSIVAVQWLLMIGAALTRMDEGIAEPSTLVYVTVTCAFGLLAAAGYQIAVWRFGLSTMKPVLGVSIAAGIVMAIIHLASLKNVDGWPALSQLGVVEWLGRAPWSSNAVLIAVALLAFRALMRVGIRVKASSEAHL